MRKQSVPGSLSPNPPESPPENLERNKGNGESETWAKWLTKDTFGLFGAKALADGLRHCTNLQKLE